MGLTFEKRITAFICCVELREGAGKAVRGSSVPRAMRPKWSVEGDYKKTLMETNCNAASGPKTWVEWSFHMTRQSPFGTGMHIYRWADESFKSCQNENFVLCTIRPLGSGSKKLAASFKSDTFVNIKTLVPFHLLHWIYIRRLKIKT